MENLFIDGEHVPSDSEETSEVENPATEEVIAEVPDAGPADVDRAVDAARRAQREWHRRRAIDEHAFAGLGAAPA